MSFAGHSLRFPRLFTLVLYEGTSRPWGEGDETTSEAIASEVTRPHLSCTNTVAYFFIFVKDFLTPLSTILANIKQNTNLLLGSYF